MKNKQKEWHPASKPLKSLQFQTEWAAKLPFSAMPNLVIQALLMEILSSQHVNLET
jgi:hypothetical protein